MPLDGPALVIGASSGIGAALAVELAGAGRPVALVARREDALREVAARCEAAAGPGVAVRAYPHDVTVHDEVAPLFERIVAEMGGLDTVVYAAGVLPRGGPDEYDFGKDGPVIGVNLTGAVAWLGQAARYMAARGRGRICGISSIAGDRGRRAFPAYHAAKAGFTTYLESLRNRLFPHGVGVTTIKPGFVDTAMTKGMDGLFWVIAPEDAARTIKRHMDRGAQVRYVPARWGLVAAVIRSIPSVLFRRLKI